MRKFLAIASGCLVVGLTAAAPSGQSAPTFYKDVLPILQNNCQTCHRPGEVAPMSLISYDEARPWARAIKTKTTAKQMPPWFADPDYGLFANERKLTAREIATLAAWADAGAPAGILKDAPPARHFEDGWNIKPDVIVEMPKPFELPATGTINYKYIVVKTNFKEDMWVVAAEMRPGNAKVLHHGKVWVRPAGSTWMKDAVPGEAYENETQRDVIGKNSPEEGNDILGKFNPGLGAQRFDQEGAAKFVPKGSDLVYEMHYTATGKLESDVSKLGLVLAKADPKKRYYFHAGPTANNLAIPAGDGHAGRDGVVRDDGRIAATSPAVGIFHPRPEARAGTKVRAGDRLGSVDMLGIPQEVVAPADGVVGASLIEPGDAVEYGQELILLEFASAGTPEA